MVNLEEDSVRAVPAGLAKVVGLGQVTAPLGTCFLRCKEYSDILFLEL